MKIYSLNYDTCWVLQVGAISPQALEPLLQSIHDCLSSSDWSTRKAAADTLIVLALHSSNLIKEKPTSTITILEAIRFDKVLFHKLTTFK